MPIMNDKVSGSAFGGTELMKHALRDRLDPELLEHIQIFVSRVHEPLSENHVRILWLHDLAEDPENKHLENDGWKKFHKLVFASNWQMRGYIERFNIPWSHCVVMQNAITPIDYDFDKDKDRENGIRLIYHTTPHRGLQLLVPVFQKLKEEFPNLTLDVYSSFKAYGWDDRDKQFEEIFKACRESDGIVYHGYVPNKDIRQALKTSHIYAYPNIWQETSCISLMEAMSAGVMTVHPNYGALYETAANWTTMYQYHEDASYHAGLFYNILKMTIEELTKLSDESYKSKIGIQKSYADVFYNWEGRAQQWNGLLVSLKDVDRSLPKASFIYRTT